MEVSPGRSGDLYAGTILTLTCTVTLDSNVDSGESVETSWIGLQDIPEQRYSVTGASGSGDSYTDSLTISPLADQDDGIYTCTVTVTGGSNVLQATASDDITITVIGEINTAKFGLLQFFFPLLTFALLLIPDRQLKCVKDYNIIIVIIVCVVRIALLVVILSIHFPASMVCVRVQ